MSPIIFRVNIFHRIFFCICCFSLFALSLRSQPVTVHKKAKMNIHSDAHSLFTRFKDRFFSNYQYLDELKNMEIHADIFSGFSLSLGGPAELFGFDAGGGFIIDYYLKEGLALRTGFGIKGYRLYRNVDLTILNDKGDTVATGTQVYRNRMTQATIPLHFLFTKFRYNRGLWTAFGVTLALNMAGHYLLENRSEGALPPGFKLPKPHNAPAFAVSQSNNSSSSNSNNGRTSPNSSISNQVGFAVTPYFNRSSVYVDVTLGYKFRRFLNFYASLQISTTPLQNAVEHTINNHSLNFGALLSLWQY